jgi:sec-independent protein translocase protein TatA
MQNYREKEITMVLDSIIAGFLGGYEWIIILGVVVLLFGGKKIPELMRGVGKGIREFKDGSKELSKESKASEPEEKKAE